MSTSDSRLSVIREFVGGHVRDAEISDDRDIFATGSVSSLFAVQLVVWVERTFGITVGPADLDIDNFRTIAHVDRFVAARQAAEPVPSPSA